MREQVTKIVGNISKNKQNSAFIFVDFKSNTNQSDIKDKYEDSIDGVNCDFFSEYTYSTSEDIYNS